MKYPDNCRYVYQRNAEPWLGNVIGEWITTKFHNAKSLADAATAAVTLKLMERDIKTNGANGGPMSVTEAAGERIASWHVVHYAWMRTCLSAIITCSVEMRRLKGAGEV